MGKEGVEVLMSAYGGIEELHVMMDKKTGLGTGAAFVIFRERKDAQRAIQELNGVHTVGGMKCPMQVRSSQRRGTLLNQHAHAGPLRRG